MKRKDDHVNHIKPKFSAGTHEFIFQLLRKDVQEIVDRSARNRQWEIRSKAIFFPLLYLFFWLIAMMWSDRPFIFYGAYIGLGLMVVIIFLNIIHEAVHRTIFKSKKLNDLFVYLFDLLGANSFIWRLRHVRFHHNYPNVNGWDTDIEQNEMVRIFPSGPLSHLHRYQHIYLPFLYPFFLFNWLLIRDFRDFFNSAKTVRKLITIPAKEYVKLFIFKFFFFFYLIFFPILFLDIGWIQALTGFILMIMTASVFSLLVLLPPHANIHAEFPIPDAQHHLPQNWFMHMLMTTNDVEEDNLFTRVFMGCFNYHVAHHLFPNVNHIYYPEITEKLRGYAAQYGLPYRRLRLISALYGHYKLIRKNGKIDDFNIWEESI